MAQNDRTRGGTFHGEMDRSVAEKTKAGPRHAVVCMNVMGRTKEEDSPNQKRARAGSLALVDQPQVASANLYPPGFWFGDVMTFFSGVTLFCCVSSSSFLLSSLKPRPFVRLSFGTFNMQAHFIPITADYAN